jgi:Na+/H+ antiporter NhaA
MIHATGTTRWHPRATPLKRFLATETGGAAALLAAAVLALTWANVDVASYRAVWSTHLGLSVGQSSVELTAQEWINSGLMAFFFFVVGLETRREFDLGELRQRRRLIIPLIAGVGGMVVPALIYVVINVGEPTVHAWGLAVSTDTALVLGIMALVGRSLPSQLRVFLLTLSVVDDIVALVVIGLAYSDDVRLMPLLVALLVFGAVLVVRALGSRVGFVYFLLGALCWFAVLQSGIDPIVVGLAMGLIAYAYPATRVSLQRASDLFRQFREQPTPQLARDVRVGVTSALSPNDRLQQLYHPWTSYVIVPLFALANTGVPLDGEALSRAATSPVTLGVVIGLLVGKPLGSAGLTWALAKVTGGRVSPPLGWAAVIGGGTVSVVAFTVSLIIANLALEGEQLEAATIGVLVSAPLAGLVTWSVFRITAALPRPRRARALYGTTNLIADLSLPVDAERDHVRGPEDALVTIVEYGDFECPYCGQAEPIVRELLADFGDVRYVWRHLPLSDVHPQAQLAAEATEAAAVQDRFWPMHDLLFQHQDALGRSDLVRYAGDLGLDVEKFQRDLDEQLGAARVASDVESADLSSVSGTPTFFINQRRHYGAYDVPTLSAAIRTARIQAGIARRSPSDRP